MVRSQRNKVIVGGAQSPLEHFSRKCVNCVLCLNTKIHSLSKLLHIVPATEIQQLRNSWKSMAVLPHLKVC